MIELKVEEPCAIALRGAPEADGVVVRTSLHSKLLNAVRLPSLAGTSLAERMRSTSFALFGLAAAAGLALVAVFAQPGGPLLAPAPLPSEPSSSVGKAEALGSGALSGGLGAVVRVSAGASPIAVPATARRGGGVRGGGSPGQVRAKGAVGATKPLGSPSSHGNEGEAGQPESAPAQSPVAAPEPEPAPAPQASPTPAPTPEKTTAHSTGGGRYAAGPGGHGSSKGEEESSSHHGGSAPPKGPHAALPPPPPPPPAEPPAAETPPPPPGNNGKGHAYGHDK